MKSRKLLSICVMCCVVGTCCFADLSASPIYGDLNSVPSSIPSSNLVSVNPAISANIDDNYVLGSGDVLEFHMIVGENAFAINYSFVINGGGNVFIPNVGEIFLSGSTVSHAKSLISKRIRKLYHEHFDLYLYVSQPKLINIYVNGQVDHPGLVAVYDGTRLSDLLKKIGVAKGGSDLSDSVILKRKNSLGKFSESRYELKEVFLENNDKNNIKLLAGDIISVPAIKSYVYVYGDVARSGTFGFVSGQTLSDYINIAGGPTARANLSSVTVTRHIDGKSNVYSVNVNDVLHRGDAQKDMQIFAGDVINVPGNFFYFSDFGSFANTLLLGLTLYNAFLR